MNNNLQSLADNLMGYCQKELGFKKPPSLFFQEDPKNAEDMLGRTAHYEPATKKIVVFVTGRHNKDILRSIAHELIHHVQNLRGEFDNDHDTSPGYAQKDSHMRNMEKEAYLLGNLLFRDWEDGLKSKRMQENKEINPVNDNIKELVKNALLEELSEKNDEDYFRTPLDKDEKLKKSIDRQIRDTVGKVTGKRKPARPPRKEEKELEEGEERERADNEPPHPYDPGQEHGRGLDSTGKKIKKEVHNMNIDTIKEMIKEKLLEALKNEAAKPDFPDIDGDGDREEPISKAAKDKKKKVDEEQEIFAPNHYCVHHGGVQHNGSVQMAEAVSHNYNKELGRVTHYDMKLEDGTILEGVAAEDIQVTNASLAEAHHMHAVRDDDEEEKKMQEADLDEITDQSEIPYPGETPEEAEARARSDRKSQRKKEGKPVEEGKILTPEQEKLLYESRFTGRDTDLFNRLVNKWIK
tara:strand:- start:1347 stop:2741 length:1395 start_codon:yes stop_codon:yes gene_type:complete